MFIGLLVFLIILFFNEEIDYLVFECLMSNFVSVEVDLICVMGFMGLYFYLFWEELGCVVKVVVDNVNGIFIMVGVGVFWIKDVFKNVEVV